MFWSSVLSWHKLNQIYFFLPIGKLCRTLRTKISMDSTTSLLWLCLRSLHRQKCNVFNCPLKFDAEHNIIDTILFLLPKYGTFNIIIIKAKLNSWVKASKGISYEAALSSTFSTTTTIHWTKHTRTLEADRQ